MRVTETHNRGFNMSKLLDYYGRLSMRVMMHHSDITVTSNCTLGCQRTTVTLTWTSRVVCVRYVVNVCLATREHCSARRRFGRYLAVTSQVLIQELINFYFTLKLLFGMDRTMAGVFVSRSWRCLRIAHLWLSNNARVEQIFVLKSRSCVCMC